MTFVLEDSNIETFNEGTFHNKNLSLFIQKKGNVVFTLPTIKKILLN